MIRLPKNVTLVDKISTEQIHMETHEFTIYNMNT